MHILIKSSLNTLEKSKKLLNKINNTSLSDQTIAPYYSSIGSHIRHVLDFYGCILYNDNDVIDLTTRTRDLTVESDCDCAKAYLEKLCDKLKSLNESDIVKLVKVEDDLGLGKIQMTYTFDALLAQANSHTIHHYAIINYILEGLNLRFDDSDFGYNPTTPKAVNLN